MEVDQPVLSPEALAANVTNEGGVEGTWRLLKNVMGLWLIQQLRSAFSARGFDRTYEELAKLAGSSRSAQSFIDPDDPMFLNPENMEEAIIEFCRQTDQVVPSDEGALARCVLESLALRYCEVLDEVSRLANTKIDVVHVVGGGCKNVLLNQFIAGATRLPVVAGPDEATSLGNIMIQCKASGEIDSLSQIRNVVRNSTNLIEFEPTAFTYWQDAKRKFRQLCAGRKSACLAKPE
jgi:rhamnulokinase